MAKTVVGLSLFHSGCCRVNELGGGSRIGSHPHSAIDPLSFPASSHSLFHRKMVVSLLLSLPVHLPSLFSCGAITMAPQGYSRYGEWGSVERSKGCGHSTYLGHCHHGVGLTIFIWFITLSLGKSMISKTMH